MEGHRNRSVCALGRIGEFRSLRWSPFSNYLDKSTKYFSLLELLLKT